MAMRYTLELNEEQASTLQAALEFFARMRIGQWEELPRACLDINDERYAEKADFMKMHLLSARRICFPELSNTFGHSYGIGKFEDADRAWEIYTSIRHCVAWAHNPKGGLAVCYDKPFSLRGNELAKCTVKDERSRIFDSEKTHNEK